MTNATTPELRQAIFESLQRATRERQASLTPEHLLLRLLDEPSSIEILRAAGADIDSMRAHLEMHLTLGHVFPKRSPHRQPEEADPKPATSQSFQRLLHIALVEARAGGRRKAGIPDALAAIPMLRDSFAHALMASQNISRSDIVNFEPRRPLKSDRSEQDEREGFGARLLLAREGLSHLSTAVAAARAAADATAPSEQRQPPDKALRP